MYQPRISDIFCKPFIPLFYNLSCLISCTGSLITFPFWITLTNSSFIHSFNQHMLSVIFYFTKCALGYPWRSSGRKFASTNVGDMGSTPGPGRFHVPWATKLMWHSCWASALESVLQNKRNHCNEKPAQCNEEWPQLAATRESPRAETKTQRSHK